MSLEAYHEQGGVSMGWLRLVIRDEKGKDVDVEELTDIGRGEIVRQAKNLIEDLEDREGGEG